MSKVLQISLINTFEAICTWIESCQRRDQCELLINVIDDFVTKERFPSEEPDVLQAARVVLFERIQYRIEFLSVAIIRKQAIRSCLR